MADADEDAIPRSHPSTSTTTDPTLDLEDEAQDFRFLAALTSSKSSASASSLPKRGEKDFEPNPTQAQSNHLHASREAMHSALSVQRVLPPTNQVVGQYLPDPRDWRWDVAPSFDNGRGGKGGRCVVVEKFSTTYARSIGVADRRNWSWLLPEEALFLLERGTLDVRWPDEKVEMFMKSRSAELSNGGGGDDGDEGLQKATNGLDVDEDENEDEDVLIRGEEDPHTTQLCVGEMPMSLQGAYASFIGKSGLTLEQYYVYAGLRRLGYIVQRATSWDEGDESGHEDSLTNGHATQPDRNTTQPSNLTTTVLHPRSPVQNPATSLIYRLISLIFPSKPLQFRPSTGPLVYPGLYRNYNDMFRALTIIPFHSSTNSSSTPSSAPQSPPKHPFNISYHVHKPSPTTKYRKSSPPQPDFRIVVLDARNSTVPTVSEIGALLDSMPTDELPKEKRMEQRLKYGVRNVILAVVDCGLVSYLRLADMCSGSEGRVAETKIARGGKRGGGRGGRGGKRGGKR